MKIDNFKIEIYADGADITSMRKAYQEEIIKGFTTNPTLMKKAGVRDYVDFVKQAVSIIPDLPINFEVFSDDFIIMESEARKLSGFGENIYVKIPIMNSKGESSVDTIRQLSHEGIKLNITAVFTVSQVISILDVLDSKTDHIISIFAGRIHDAGQDAERIVREAVSLSKEKTNVKILWASCRELYNIIQAEQCGANIITLTDDILKKLPLLGMNLEKFSLETVQMFERDARSLGYSI